MSEPASAEGGAPAEPHHRVRDLVAPGVRRIVAPARNEPDLEDIPEHLRKGLEFRWVEEVVEVFELALEPARNGRRRSKGPVGGMLAGSPNVTPSER